MLRDWDYSSSYRFVDGLVTPNMVGGEPDWTKLDDLFSQSVGHSAVMQAMTKDGKEIRWMAEPDSWNDRSEFEGITMHLNPMMSSGNIQA